MLLFFKLILRRKNSNSFIAFYLCVPVCKFAWILGWNVYDFITKKMWWYYSYSPLLGCRVQPTGMPAVLGNHSKQIGESSLLLQSGSRSPIFAILKGPPVSLCPRLSQPNLQQAAQWSGTALLMKTFTSATLNQFHCQGKWTSLTLRKPTPVLRPPHPDMKEKCYSWLNNSAQKIKYVTEAFEGKSKSGCHAFRCPDSHALYERRQVLLQTQFVLPWQ